MGVIRYCLRHPVRAWRMAMLARMIMRLPPSDQVMVRADLSEAGPWDD